MSRSPAPRRGRAAFDRFAEAISDIASGAAFFTASLVVVVLWLPTIVVFADVDTWQLVINTATSILAFLLIALLQNSERRTDRATSEKLDAIATGLVDLLSLQQRQPDPEQLSRHIDACATSSASNRRSDALSDGPGREQGAGGRERLAASRRAAVRRRPWRAPRP
jgi:low affinity Fe/Cu permease